MLWFLSTPIKKLHLFITSHLILFSINILCKYYLIVSLILLVFFHSVCAA